MSLPRSCTLLLLAAAIPAAEADPITVTARREEAPLAPPVVETTPGADAGAHLRDQPGVEGVRMGGLGIDPVIHGQSASRLAVETDGACPRGGCPNRMDPPTTYAPAGADLIAVEPGVTGVRRYGAPGGTVRLERDTPRFAPGEDPRLRVDARGGANGRAAEGGLDLGLGRPEGFLRGAMHSARAEDYEDGDGRRVHSAYRSSRAGGVLGWTPDGGSRIEASGDAVAERDVCYAGAGMDSPESDGRQLRLRGVTVRDDGTELRAGAWRSEVDHEMDNYSLRPVTGMRMRAPSTSDALGGNASLAVPVGAATLAAGLDGERVDQDARRYQGMTSTTITTLNSVLWPDARQDRVGAWIEAGLPVAEDHRLVAGVRGDQVRSEARAASLDPAGAAMSPAQLYHAYYGATGLDRDERLLAASARWEWTWSARGTAGLVASRTPRAADITERFIAGNGATAAARWVGNPDLDPEVHQQLQAVADWREPGAGSWRIELWGDRVADFIRRDRARSQDGVLLGDLATIYHGTEAALAGASGAGTVDATRQVELGGDAGWTWAQDLDTGRPLPQIAPLSGTLWGRLHDAAEVWSTRLAMRWAARQTRVDASTATGSALDLGETPAWLALDWSASWSPVAWATLEVGVDNLLDRTYAEHLNKASAFDTAVARVNEPGRACWAGGTMRF